MKLDLGSGSTPREGFESVDLFAAHSQHKVDLLEFPWPWEDSTVDELYCSHFLEHIPMISISRKSDRKSAIQEKGMVDLLCRFMDEAYRVLKPSGKFTVVVPSGRSNRAFQDPTHRRFFVEESFQYFNKGWRLQNGLDHYLGTCDFDVTVFPIVPERVLAMQPNEQARDIAGQWNSTIDLHFTLISIKDAQIYVEQYRNTVLHDKPIVHRYWVTPNILVGGNITSQDDYNHLVADYGITGVVNLEYPEQSHGLEIPDTAELHVPDNGDPFPKHYVKTAVDYAKARKGKPIYVHCAMGMSRSPHFAYAILRGCYDMSPDDALLTVKKALPSSTHHWGFGLHTDKYIPSIENALKPDRPRAEARMFMIDNFLENPDAARELALQQVYQENEYYKGFRSTTNHYSEEIDQRIKEYLGQRLEYVGASFHYHYSPAGTPEVYHADPKPGLGDWGAVLYLNPSAPVESGTSLFRHKKTGMTTGDPGSYSELPGPYCYFDPTEWEEIAFIGNVYNRLVLFQSDSVHSMRKPFGSNVGNSRLTQLFFIK